MACAQDESPTAERSQEVDPSSLTGLSAVFVRDLQREPEARFRDESTWYSRGMWIVKQRDEENLELQFLCHLGYASPTLDVRLKREGTKLRPDVAMWEFAREGKPENSLVAAHVEIDTLDWTRADQVSLRVVGKRADATTFSASGTVELETRPPR